jgi:tetratricopeptide (TPR) repeat protein
MKTLFIALEGMTAAELGRARGRGELPSLDRLAVDGLVAPMSFPLADARAASLVTAMSGCWPDQHGILMAETSDAMDGSLRPMKAEDRAQPSFWEILDAAGEACVCVGWPIAITGETKHSAIVDGVQVHPPDLAPSLADCRLQPDELDGPTLAPLAPQWQKVDQAVDARLAGLATVVAENMSRQAAFLDLLDTQPWECATICLSLPGELTSLEHASRALADDVFEGLADRGMALLEALMAEILKRIPAEVQILVAGLPHAETPAAPGFLIVHGSALIPGAGLNHLSLSELAPLVWRLCGYQSRSSGLQIIRADYPAKALNPASAAPKNQRPLAHPRLLEVAAPIVKNPGEALTAAEFWHYNALNVLGRSLAAREEWLPAYAALEATTRLAPNDIRAKLLLVGCQQRLGLLTEALDTAYAAIHPAHRGDPGPLLLAAELEALQGGTDAARNLLKQAAPILPGIPDRRLMQANALMALRDWSAATAVLLVLSQAAPDDPQVDGLLARCYLAQQQSQNAFEHAIRAAQASPQNHLAFELMGHALLGLGLQAQAWQAFERATQVRPPWPRPWANLIQLARQMQKPAAEIAELTEHYHQLKQAQQARRDAWRQALAASP